MPRFRIRLIAFVTLASYLLANTHAGVWACAAELVRERPQSDKTPDSTQQSEETSDEQQNPRPPCKHCAVKVACQPEQTDEQSPCDEKPGDESPALHDSNELCQDTCPCCPKCPGDKPCHLPGGCAYCNVAKIPCVADMPLSIQGFLCLGEACCELAILYISPSSGCLIRPPKI